MTLAPASKITLDGKPAKSTDLKVGQTVKCTADKEGVKVTGKVSEKDGKKIIEEPKVEVK